MRFYSHSEYIPDKKERKGSKLLYVHTESVSKKAINAFFKNVKFNFNNILLKNALNLICKYHDFGKYTNYFQNYLLNKGDIYSELKKHAFMGACISYEKLMSENKNLGIIAFFINYHHHLNLRDVGIIPAIVCDNYKRKIFEEQKADIQKNLSTIKLETKEEKINEYLIIPENSFFRKTVRRWLIKETNIQNYYLINYLFSLLIEADKLDASRTKPYARVTIPTHLVNDHILGLMKGKINPKDLRNEVRLTVLKNLGDKELFEKRLFTLTAPTGIGKTLTSLDFALKLRDKLPNKPQIIYGLPFINIIEQAIDVYNQVFAKDEVKVLAHYQYADALGQQEKCDEKDGGKGYDQKLMTLDTWQCDIVITTFVQVLQTLIGNRNKMLKRFNHFAGSIIILDEVQTIKLGLQPLVGAALFYLSKFLDTRIILMTATKPKIFELANNHILKLEGEEAKPMELLNEYEQVFSKFNRTAIYPLIDKDIINEEDFLENIFKKKWGPTKSCLIVCNKVDRSIDIFNTVNSHIEEEEEFQNPVYYLSTNIAPCVRLNIIEQIKLDLKYRRNPILISTQSVEAGVDLDFDMGFRDLGPIDSIIQVAGRINRNNDYKKNYSPLYVLAFQKRK